MSDLNFFSGATNKSESKSFLNEQANWMKQALGQYGPTLGQGQKVYDGQRIAPLTDTQQGLLGSLGSWSQYLQPTTGGAMYAQTGAALSDILSGQMGAEPYTESSVNQLFKSAYEAPAMRNWRQFEKPQIQEAYSGPGYWSTARMKAVQEGASNLGSNLASQYGQLRWAADRANKDFAESRAGRALAGIPLAGDYISQPQQQAMAGLAGTGNMYNLASMEQRQAQADIDANIQRFVEENRLTDPESLQVLMNLLGMNYSTSKGRGTSDQLGMRWVGGLGNAPQLPNVR